jgi:uncharacterized RDD family membrane protein YckC
MTPPAEPPTAAAPANATAPESVLNRMARTYVPTRGPVRPTWRQRWAQRRPPRALAGMPSTLGRRLAARLIDMSMVLIAAAGTVDLMAHGAHRHVRNGDFAVLALFIGILLGYETLAIAMFGRTLGKWIMELRIMGTNGYRTAVWSAAVRALMPCWLNIITFGLLGTWCYLSPVMDEGEWKRGWHDRAARTVVVYCGLPAFSSRAPARRPG